MISIGDMNVSKYNSTQQLKIQENKNFTQIKYREKTQKTSFSGKIDFKDFEKIREQSENDIEAFEKFINKIFSYQGSYTSRRTTSIKSVHIKIKSESAEAVEEPSQEITGYWGAEETSQRILDFAKKISGNNPEKFDLLIDAFKTGFEEAKKAFGGTLPEVSHKTYDLVMEGFEKMKDEASISEE
jgi:hypothetical protein